jgi:hypothetical protein
LWVLYAPVVIHGLWLALRYRGFTVFTAVNPGMPAASGLVGQSKAEILRGLAAAGDRVAAWTLVAPGPLAERQAALAEFKREHALAWPVVLKPDRGERGEDVVIARGQEQADEVLQRVVGPLIAQTYVSGVEFGVFYVRRPGAAEGEIFAVTEKHNLAVVGDGQSSLGDLVLADDRAVNMAKYFRGMFGPGWEDVPRAGERVQLGELGTHCRGAVFLEGMGHVTARLVEEIDRVSRCYEGFHFGRYDVRAESRAAFQRGEFQVIELNGVTSEATSIYDPRYSVWHGWRVLCRQWRLAFAFGAVQRRRGARVWSVGEVWQLWQEHRRA